MPIYRLDHEQWVPHPLQEVFQFFAAAENLEQLTPPFLRFQIMQAPKKLEAGSEIKYKLRVHGLPIRWLTIIDEWDPPNVFVDVQAKGPYKLWHHTHRFRSENGGTWIEDHVRYSLPFGVLGGIVHSLMVRRDVKAIFRYREQKIREIFP
jgi:ligand-binding SRPBCC domain-containing protein